jgi:hypothetical protein
LRCLAKTPEGRPASAAELARLLRELPPSNVWTEADALRWWREFRRTEATTTTDGTVSITIDLGKREPSEPPRFTSREPTHDSLELS